MKERRSWIVTTVKVAEPEDEYSDISEVLYALFSLSKGFVWGPSRGYYIFLTGKTDLAGL